MFIEENLGNFESQSIFHCLVSQDFPCQLDITLKWYCVCVYMSVFMSVCIFIGCRKLKVIEFESKILSFYLQILFPNKVVS